jgi:hypothetical protein
MAGDVTLRAEMMLRTLSTNTQCVFQCHVEGVHEHRYREQKRNRTGISNRVYFAPLFDRFGIVHGSSIFFIQPRFPDNNVTTMLCQLERDGYMVVRAVAVFWSLRAYN